MSIVGREAARILIVDDEPANLKLLDRMLAWQGYEALVLLDDPREVIARYRETRPDLILLDIKNVPQGMEFFSLETLFGAALTSGEPVIAYHPAHDLRRGG